MKPFVGIDFGTTNTAVAIADQAGPPELALFPAQDGPGAPTWRTILYFEPVDQVGADPSGVAAGSHAIARYLHNEGQGRLIQSIKSHLASALFSQTSILGRRWTLEALIGEYLRQVRGALDVDLGSRAVVGRPVRYWGADADEDDARALDRMRRALGLAGFDEVVFEYEPIAASSLYASRLDHDELVFIADFGGGTSDFSLLRVGPGVEPGDTSAILATGGIGIGGDTFDGRVINSVVAPLLGKGTSYSDPFGATTPVPVWIYNHLRRWHQLSFLKTKKTMALLERIQRGSSAPTRIGHLIHLIDHDLGLPLHQSIEQVKLSLSEREDAYLRFIQAPIALSSYMERGQFTSLISPDVDAVDSVIAATLERARVSAADIDRVFMTGGSSFVPAIRSRLRDRFGEDCVVGGGELTSVAWGLAVRARQLFA